MLPAFYRVSGSFAQLICFFFLIYRYAHVDERKESEGKFK